MKFLADANIESAIIQWLRSCGYDVLWAAELSPSTPDTELVSLANCQDRVLLTHDRDFGELVFLRGSLSHGAILLRFDVALQSDRLRLLQQHWSTIEANAHGNFVVVSERKVRLRPLP